MRQLEKSRLFLNTVSYLEPAQLWHRARRLARYRVCQLMGRSLPHTTVGELKEFVPVYVGLNSLHNVEGWEEQVHEINEKAQAIAQGHFEFLNRLVDLSDGAGWHASELSRLWRYHLHYFDYVLPLLVWAHTDSANKATDAFERLVKSWIEHNEARPGDGWHPYTLSLRVVNWLHAIADLNQIDASPFFGTLLASLYGQTQYLYDNLEFDVRGNHLLENLRALIWAGIAFRGSEPEKWFNRALDLLKIETAEQILPDGGHFERVPGYHLVVLKDYLEICIWLRRNKDAVPPWLESALRRMLDYLLIILPPDNRVPLLKDTAWNAMPDSFDLLDSGALYFQDPRYKLRDDMGFYPLLLWGKPGWERFQALPRSSHRTTSTALDHSEYYIFRDDELRDYLIFDAGKPCPDYLPAHSHADLLSYELLVGGERVVVDSGVYEYEAGRWRDYFRSTRAHNTVEVEGENQSEVWSSFRLGKRASPNLRNWEVTDFGGIIQAEHNGYARFSPKVYHRRTVVWVKDDFWLVVDELLGEGTVEAVNYVHFEPRLTLTSLDSSLWRIAGSSTPLYISSLGDNQIDREANLKAEIQQGWYSAELGSIHENEVLTFNANEALPILFAYAISKGHPLSLRSYVNDGRQFLEVERHQTSHTLVLSIDENLEFR
jgi:hypothetical protein